MKNKICRLFNHEVEGIGVIEIILILVILIGLVLIFKNQITSIINQAFESIMGNTSKIIGN